MKVTVLIPVYNKAPYLRECLESVIRQTFSDLEIVAVDDKSTDDSLAILRSMTDPRLRVLTLPENLGPAGAANAGLDAARGEYIVRLDADDIAVPERVALQVAYMDAHPEIGASGGQLKLFGGEDESWSYPLSPEACAAQLVFGVPVSQGASIMRRSVLEQHGLRYDPSWPRVGEDWLFWVRMARHTRFGNLDKVLILYRRGEQNSGHGRDRVADYAFLQREVFRSMAIPFTEEELDLHLLGLRIFKLEPDRQNIRRLRAWYDRLLELNAERGFAPQGAFEQRVEQLWSGLFHLLPQYGTAVALEHLRSTGQWPLDRLVYLLKYRVNARLGRLPAS
jgi:glycosyltransferase involved in cell wall biosynthesis